MKGANRMSEKFNGCKNFDDVYKVIRRLAKAADEEKPEDKYTLPLWDMVKFYREMTELKEKFRYENGKWEGYYKGADVWAVMDKYFGKE